jgi:hypothetical protein
MAEKLNASVWNNIGSKTNTNTSVSLRLAGPFARNIGRYGNTNTVKQGVFKRKLEEFVKKLQDDNHVFKYYIYGKIVVVCIIGDDGYHLNKDDLFKYWGGTENILKNIQKLPIDVHEMQSILIRLKNGLSWNPDLEVKVSPIITEWINEFNRLMAEAGVETVGGKLPNVKSTTRRVMITPSQPASIDKFKKFAKEFQEKYKKNDHSEKNIKEMTTLIDKMAIEVKTLGQKLGDMKQSLKQFKQKSKKDARKK